MTLKILFKLPIHKSSYYQVSQTVGLCQPMAAAVDADDDAVSYAHPLDSVVQCRRLAGPASVHDDDLHLHINNICSSPRTSYDYCKHRHSILSNVDTATRVKHDRR